MLSLMYLDLLLLQCNILFLQEHWELYFA